jgi:hypothetical protein
MEFGPSLSGVCDPKLRLPDGGLQRLFSGSAP